MLSRHNLHHEIRNRLNSGATIVVSEHAQLRMDERGVTTQDIWDTLYRGMATGNTSRNEKNAGTLCRISFNRPRNAISLVIDIPDRVNSIYIVTVYVDG